MAFRDNSVLITTAVAVAVDANGTNDTYLQAADGATAFLIADGNVGDDTFLSFGTDDSLITGRRIFDGNNDGFIAFGPNGQLDVDRTSRTNAGMDQLILTRGGDDDIQEIRFLGSKAGSNQFVYADSLTLRTLALGIGDNTPNDDNRLLEGTVGNDTLNAAGANTVILHDNQLGLNLGEDRITNFGADDLFVTTEELFDRNGDGRIDFFTNDVLDTSGSNGPQPTDPTTGPGGQVDFNGGAVVTIQFLGEVTAPNGVTFYVYGLPGSTAELPDFSV